MISRFLLNQTLRPKELVAGAGGVESYQYVVNPLVHNTRGNLQPITESEINVDTSVYGQQFYLYLDPRATLGKGSVVEVEEQDYSVIGIEKRSGAYLKLVVNLENG